MYSSSGLLIKSWNTSGSYIGRIQRSAFSTRRIRSVLNVRSTITCSIRFRMSGNWNMGISDLSLDLYMIYRGIILISEWRYWTRLWRISGLEWRYVPLNHLEGQADGQENIFKFNQRRLACVKYLGELYMYRAVSATVIFDTLWSLISFGHRKLPRSESCW